jgi:hypothetical protein
MSDYKPDSNLLQSDNEDLNDGPRLGPDKIIPTDYSLGLQYSALNPFASDFSIKNPICRIIKVFPSISLPKVGSYLWTKRNSQNLNLDKPVLQAYAVATNAQSQVIPYPKNILNPDQEDVFLTTFHIFIFTEDEQIIASNLKVNDKVQIEFVGNDYAEARIIRIIHQENNNVTQESQTSPSEAAQNNSDGTTIADTRASTTGDVTQDLSNNALSDKPSTECGLKTSKTYPLQPCKTAKLDSNGQTVTLHPVFWDKINNLLNEIKQKENGYTIAVGETIRSQQKQFGYRKQRCPAALEQKGSIGGEEWLKTANWPEVVKNFKCKDTTAVAAASGAYASNHLLGLAVDFVMDVRPCRAKNKNLASYEKCIQTSKVYNYLNKYASKYGILNLVGESAEAWHWSHNGR